jgi:hypothetical protein
MAMNTTKRKPEKKSTSRVLENTPLKRLIILTQMKKLCFPL